MLLGPGANPSHFWHNRTPPYPWLLSFWADLSSSQARIRNRSIGGQSDKRKPTQNTKVENKATAKQCPTICLSNVTEHISLWHFFQKPFYDNLAPLCANTTDKHWISGSKVIGRGPGNGYCFFNSRCSDWWVRGVREIQNREPSWQTPLANGR